MLDDELCQKIWNFLKNLVFTVKDEISFYCEPYVILHFLQIIL